MARKRKTNYGDGSVYQDKKTGRWRVEFPDGKGGTIKRRAATRAEAETIRDQFKAQRAKNKTSVKEATQTFDELNESWWELSVKPRRDAGQLKESTLEVDKRTIELHVLPHIGHIRLIDIRPRTILQMVATVTSESGASVADRALSKVIQILNAAVRWEILDSNPALKARFDVPTLKRKQPAPLTLPEARTLISFVHGHRMEALYIIGMVLGLRLGELLGLSWHNYDEDAGELSVKQQVQKDGIVPWTKTDAGVRLVPVPEWIKELLAERKIAWAKEMQSVEWKEHFLIFPSTVGTPMAPRNLQRQLSDISADAGLRHLTPHMLRHTCSTCMGVERVLEEVRAAVLGHGKKGVTQHYTKAQLASMREAVESVERMLRVG
jgi:integrase